MSEQLDIDELRQRFAKGERRFHDLLVTQATPHAHAGFAEAQFDGCVFEGLDTNIHQVEKAVFKDCRFIKCKLTSCRFAGATIRSTTFVECTMESTDFTRATLVDCRIERGKCSSVGFTEAEFER